MPRKTHCAVELRTEYLVNPLGIDEKKPRFFWKMQDNRRDARQRGYRIIVHDQNRIVWDSGDVASDSSIHIEYAGTPLKAFTRYTWKVKIRDAGNNESDWSEPAWFETGFLNQANLKASWIQTDSRGQQHELLPVALMRKEFTLRADVTRARIYASALGVYELHINGARVGCDYFTPGWTQYQKRVQYQAYDVTALVKKGDNVIGALLGDGWYRGTICGTWEQKAIRYGDRPRLLVQLIMECSDGSAVTVVTDGTWAWTTGAILFSDIYMGEEWDSRKDISGWDSPGKPCGTWKNALVYKNPGIKIVWSCGPRVRNTQIIRPKTITAVKGKWIIDMGQNMVGWLRFTVAGKNGTEITIRHAERLNPDGTIYTENLRKAKATATYRLKGGRETLEPHFTYFGFQYVEISGWPGTPSTSEIEGVVLHSDMPFTGDFTCNDTLVNQLQKNIVWGQRGNYFDVPTDCPQRDERLGWTGDAQVFMRTATYNMDVSSFFVKWHQDLNDARRKDGAYSCVAPTPPGDTGGGSAAWGDAGIICPLLHYRVYGDTRELVKHYNGMVKWMKYQKNSSKNWVNKSWGFGDWLNIDAPTPQDLISTAFFAYTSKLMAKIAGIIGKKNDVFKWEKQFKIIKKVFNDEFITPNGRITGNTQTAALLALHFGLVDGRHQKHMLEFLVEDIKRRHMHLSSGFVGSPYINHVLTRFGETDTAYNLLFAKNWPSWLYAVTQGATTIWERWDGWTHDKGFQTPSMNSFNHYAYGAIGEWLFSQVAGINMDESAPAYKKILIQPTPFFGKGPRGEFLSHAGAFYESIHGTITCGWKRNGRRLIVEVTIPANTTATFVLPAAKKQKISVNGTALAGSGLVKAIKRTADKAVCAGGAGKYRFEII